MAPLNTKAHQGAVLPEQDSQSEACYQVVAEPTNLNIQIMLTLLDMPSIHQSLHLSSTVYLFYGLQATQEELKSSYRRLCMLYHPDKHRDPELKKQAEQLFTYLHQAYEGKYYNSPQD